MADEELGNQDTESPPGPENVVAPKRKKSSRGLLIISVVFVALVASVFLTQSKDPIDWVEDYQAGLELAKEQNKPVLLAFYKQFAPMVTSTFNDTYKDPDVKEFVEESFVPILIDVDKHPEIAKQYEVNYYPTHYVKRPDSDSLFGPRKGYDPPALFIKELKRLLEEMESLDK